MLSRRLLSMFLICILTVSLLNVNCVNVDASNVAYPYVIFAGSDDDEAISFSTTNLCVNGRLTTNGTIKYNHFANINGIKKEHANEKTPDLFKWINENSSDKNTYIKSGSISVEKNIRLSSADIMSSESGDITVNATDVELNGLVYAPYGTVDISAVNLNMNSVIIIANRVNIRGTNVNINYNSSIASKIRWTESINSIGDEHNISENGDTSPNDEENQSNTEDDETNDDTKYSVSFNTGGVLKKNIPTQYVKEGEYAEDPDIVSSDGYIFLGWYIDEELNNEFDINSTPITKNTTLYAYWYNDNDKTDSDNDSFSDEFERLLGLDSESDDSDSDGLSDYVELYNNLDTNPLERDSDVDGILDGDEDYDEDGLINKREIELGTEPELSDTDSDGLPDGEEVNKYKTDPMNKDTDSDSLSDMKEVLYGTDPLVFDNEVDVTACAGKDSYEEADIDISVSLNGITCEQAESLQIKPVVNDALFPKNIPGYMGCAYDISMDGGFDTAKLSFTYDRVKNCSSDPVVYYYNETEQCLEPLETTVINNIATAVTEHFSRYILIDRTAYENSLEWVDEFDVVENDARYNSATLHLLVEDTYSIARKDRQDVRLDDARNFIDYIPEGVKTTISRYGSTRIKLCDDIVDKNKMKDYLTPRMFVGRDGGTIKFVLETALYDVENKPASGLNIIAIFGSERVTNDIPSEEIIEKAKRLNARIYYFYYNYDDGYYEWDPVTRITIPHRSFKEACPVMSDIIKSTGGEYFPMSDRRSYAKVFSDVSSDALIVTDSDCDGISDYYEDNLPYFNGVKMMLDKNNPDTDGDGVLDGDEIEELKYVYNLDNTKVRVYGKLKTDPTKIDSDGDGLLDYVSIKHNGKEIAPKDNKPLEYNGPHNLWKDHIWIAKNSNVGTEYESLDNHKSLNQLLLCIPSIRIANFVKVRATDVIRYCVRKQLIANEEELDENLLKNENEFREAAMALKMYCTGEEQAAIGASILNFYYDEYEQAYHSLSETWQRYFGYTKLFDDIFHAGSNMDSLQIPVTVGGVQYALWLWKGDYWNLGTGAEMGLYQMSEETKMADAQSAAAHFDSVKYELPMQLSLYKYTYRVEKTYFNWIPNAEQWWITGFDWRNIKPDVNSLVSIGCIELNQHPELIEPLYKELSSKILVGDVISAESKLWYVWEESYE